jgi:hypothetical protein
MTFRRAEGLSKYKSEVYATEFSRVRILQLRGLIEKVAKTPGCKSVVSSCMLYDAAVPIIYWNLFFACHRSIIVSSILLATCCLFCSGK